MPNRSEYLKNLYQEIDKELYIFNNSVEFSDISELKIINELWKDRKIDEIKAKLDALIDNHEISFIVPEENTDEESFREVGLIRLFCLFTLVSEIIDIIPNIKDQEVYQKLVLRYPNSLIDFTEISSLTVNAYKYIETFYGLIKELSIPRALKSFSTYLLKKMATLISKENDINAYYVELYDFFEYCNSFLEQMEDQEFDWGPKTIEKANRFMGYIFIMESMLYYLLLFKEDYLEEQHQKTNITVQDIRFISVNRDEIINELETIRTLDKYQDHQKK